MHSILDRNQSSLTIDLMSSDSITILITLAKYMFSFYGGKSEKCKIISTYRPVLKLF